MLAGYRHRQYAESFAEVGAPLGLSRCGGWLVERSIAGSSSRDAMGCYPLFDCLTWRELPVDLSGLAESHVSVALVTNPFAAVDASDLRRWFDVVIPYKQHYVTDLEQPALAGRMHRRNVQRAQRRVEVTVCPDPGARLDEWCALYGELVVRRGIAGLRTFSRASFEKQLAVPGLVMFRGAVDDETVGLHLWYVDGQVAYGHLGATSTRGYELMASYALYGFAVRHFQTRARWLDLGGVAGLSDDDPADGLRRFKAGWATGTRQSYLCGRILQPDVYARLVVERVRGATTYFPAYREGEFSSANGRARISVE
jgi:hypothetical protein